MRFGQCGTAPFAVAEPAAICQQRAVQPVAHTGGAVSGNVCREQSRWVRRNIQRSARRRDRTECKGETRRMLSRRKITKNGGNARWA